MQPIIMQQPIQQNIQHPGYDNQVNNNTVNPLIKNPNIQQESRNIPPPFMNTNSQNEISSRPIPSKNKIPPSKIPKTSVQKLPSSK